MSKQVAVTFSMTECLSTFTEIVDTSDDSIENLKGILNQRIIDAKIVLNNKIPKVKNIVLVVPA